MKAGVNKTEWHLIDAKDKVLGRVATQAATLLMGKHRTDWAAHTVVPVNVIITNADHVVLTGAKEQTKAYRWYTGYPGGLRRRSISDQRARDSRTIIREAVAGMLPKNSLRAKRLLHLKVYSGAEHPHMAQRK